MVTKIIGFETNTRMPFEPKFQITTEAFIEKQIETHAKRSSPIRNKQHMPSDITLIVSRACDQYNNNWI